MATLQRFYFFCPPSFCQCSGSVRFRKADRNNEDRKRGGDARAYKTINASRKQPIRSSDSLRRGSPACLRSFTSCPRGCWVGRFLSFHPSKAPNKKRDHGGITGKQDRYACADSERAQDTTTEVRNLYPLCGHPSSCGVLIPGGVLSASCSLTSVSCSAFLATGITGGLTCLKPLGRTRSSRLGNCFRTSGSAPALSSHYWLDD
jgi:hypothetical protein